MRPLAFYIGLKVTCHYIQKIIKWSQSKYIKKILDEYKLLKGKTIKIHIQKFSLLFYEKKVLAFEKTKYTRKIRFIIYVMVKTSIDMLFAISKLSCFLKNSELKYFSIIDQI